MDITDRSFGTKTKYITDIYFDCETTGLNPYCSELITAFFYIDDDNTFELKARPLDWSYEAQQIHKISLEDAMNFPEKKHSYRELLKWLPKNFRFITFVNKNTELGIINFDVALLVNELNLLGTPNYWLENTLGMKQPISVHTIARQLGSKGNFRPYVNPETNRASYSQVNVYKALFGETYNAHDAKEDVMALVRIHKELLRLKDENKTIFNFS